ncbi:uncharacterized protein LOC131479143, partial [Ochotona princeps]|uniref:uncharacterized protein LOC131479143 n=1 Tax=Ochotona princeps TaxID=9978 RepID=UPI002714EB65
YKMILDLLRTTPKLERVYHETARRAFLFCKENQRPQEFKRLCDVLRSHFTIVVKNRHKEDYEGLLRPDLHLETRMLQLVVAADLLLWRECAATAEDLLTLGLHDSFVRTIRTNQELFHRSREKLMIWLAIYYEKMAKVTWVADNYLFHALAWLKLLLHIKGYKRNASIQDLQSMASVVVLAVLAIPVSGLEREEGGSGSGLQETLLSPSSGSLEQQKRMAMLLGHSTLPTREALKNVLYSKDIVSLADESCQQLLALVESEFPPLKLCSLCEPLLERISKNPTLEPYVIPLKRVIFHKLIFQLSRVYATLSIKHFTTHICTNSFLPWSEAEKLFVALVQQQQQQAALLAQQQLAGGGVLCIRLDYATSAILFETPEAAAANVLKHQLSNLAKHIDKAIHMISPGQSPEERLEREAFIAELPSRLEAETKRMAERTRITHSRRLEKQEEQQRVEEERRRREAEQRRVEERQERERREEATRRREERRMQQEKIKQRSETAAQMLEEIKKIGGKASSTILIKGKQLGEINIDDVLQGNVDYDDLERAQLMQLNKEKLARQRQRRQNYRRVCHFIRACREEELPLLMRWQEETLAQDSEILLEMQTKQEEEHKAAFQAALEEKQVFEVIKKDKEAWVAARLEERQKEFEVQAQQQRERLTEVLKQQKIQRARVRKEEHFKRLKLEAERRRMEEEQKRYLEQMEKKRQEEETKARRLAELAERQMQRELEVEEKQRQLDKELLSRQGGGGGRGGLSADNMTAAGAAGGAATTASPGTMSVLSSPTPGVSSGIGGAPPSLSAGAGGSNNMTAAAGGIERGSGGGGGPRVGGGGGGGVEDDWRRGGGGSNNNVGGAAGGGGGGSSNFDSKQLSGRRERLSSGRGGGSGGAGGAGGGAMSPDEGFERWRSGNTSAAGGKEGGVNAAAGGISGAPSGRPRVRLAAAAAALNAAVGAAGPAANNNHPPPMRMQQQQQQNGQILSRATAAAPPFAAAGITDDDEGFTTVSSRPGTGQHEYYFPLLEKSYRSSGVSQEVNTGVRKSIGTVALLSLILENEQQQQHA